MGQLMAKTTQTGFWRRLKGYVTAAPADLEEDRRGWGRFPSDIHTTCRLLNEEGGPPVAARVRNVSRRGINLLLNRPFEAGDLLDVEIPDVGGAPPTETALACVIHVNDQRPEGWVVGCTFSAELSDDDLVALGVPARDEGPEQRTRERFACDVAAKCECVNEPTLAWNAQVQNVSAVGVGLLADRALENGTLLNLELRGATGEAIPTMLACVVHVTRLAEGKTVLGCNFMRELSEEELKTLLG
jgi:hypothetical protein